MHIFTYEQWSDTWLLSFNVTKCKILHIGNPAANCNHKYILHGVMLELLEDICDLGICMDSKLKFHIHTDFSTNKTNHILGLVLKYLNVRTQILCLNYTNP